VVALDRLGGHTPASSEKTTTHGATTLGVDNYNTANWACVNQAYQIQIWRTISGGTPATTGLIATIPGAMTTDNYTGTCHYDDHGDAGNGATAPTTNTTGVNQAPIINAVTGFRINGAAGSGHYPKGDGTNFIESTGSAAGTGSCTNQFVTATNSDAAPTCSTAVLPSSPGRPRRRRPSPSPMPAPQS
jgi:hypothetical protein